VFLCESKTPSNAVRALVSRVSRAVSGYAFVHGRFPPTNPHPTPTSGQHATRNGRGSERNGLLVNRRNGRLVTAAAQASKGRCNGRL